MKILPGRHCAKIKFILLKCFPCVDLAFDPDFIDVVTLPIGEKTYTVPPGYDSIKILFQRFNRKLFKYILPNGKCGNDIECDFCNQAQCPQPDYGCNINLSPKCTAFVC